MGKPVIVGKEQIPCEGPTYINVEEIASMLDGAVGDQEMYLQVFGFNTQIKDKAGCHKEHLLQLYYPQVIKTNAEKAIVLNAITELTVMVQRLKGIVNNSTI